MSKSKLEDLRKERERLRERLKDAMSFNEGLNREIRERQEEFLDGVYLELGIGVPRENITINLDGIKFHSDSTVGTDLYWRYFNPYSKYITISCGEWGINIDSHFPGDNLGEVMMVGRVAGKCLENRDLLVGHFRDILLYLKTNQRNERTLMSEISEITGEILEAELEERIRVGVIYENFSETFRVHCRVDYGYGVNYADKKHHLTPDDINKIEIDEVTEDNIHYSIYKIGLA